MPTQVTGAEQIIAQLNKIALALSPSRIQSIMEQAGFAGEAEAKGRARYRTGAMRAATKWTQQGPDIGTIGSSVNYAIYNELGTYKMSAQPFIAPGALVVKDQIMVQLSSLLSF